jgi:tetratricopeptide (TPR) repeat protein
MTANGNGKRIETLIAAEEWEKAQKAIEKQLDKEPDSHWLWSRLSCVKYEQRDYQGALEAAQRALAIVPDCPLALWDRANALDMLGKTKEAALVYSWLLRRGFQEIKEPDEDAEECWEGEQWTWALVVDCIFRIADCLAKTGAPDEAVALYQSFLFFLRHGVQGIYTVEDGMAALRKLMPDKEKIAGEMVDKEKALKELETVKKQTKRLEKVLTA